MAPAPRNYEEASSSQTYATTPQEYRQWKGYRLSSHECLLRYCRTARFLSAASCFVDTDVAWRCCQRDSPDTCPWGEFHTKELCCAKEHWRRLLFGPTEVDTSRTRESWLAEDARTVGRWNATRFQSQDELGGSTFPGDLLARPPSCSSLEVWETLPLVDWTRHFLQLPPEQVAGCTAGVLAPRLLAAPLPDVEESLSAIRASWKAKCPTPRALVVLRRHLMLWHHFLGGEEQDLAMAPLLRTLRSLEQCRLDSEKEVEPSQPDATTIHSKIEASDLQRPVVQLHMPKTAGTALCFWAEEAGFKVRRFLNGSCYPPGDGAYWLGEPALPRTCATKAKLLANANTTWMTSERWMDLPLCEELRYVTLLRDPVIRTVRQMRHHHLFFLTDDEVAANQKDVDARSMERDYYSKLWTLARVNFSTGAPSDTERIGKITGLNNWLGLWIGLASNYQVRALAGGSGAFLENVVNVGSSALAVAQSILEQIDVVLVAGEETHLGQMEADHLMEFLFPGEQKQAPPIRHYSHYHGPTTTPAPYSRWPGPGRSPDQIVRMRTWARGEWSKLKEMNAADELLVKYARLLQYLDSKYLRLVRGTRSRREVSTP